MQHPSVRYHPLDKSSLALTRCMVCSHTIKGPHLSLDRLSSQRCLIRLHCFHLAAILDAILRHINTPLPLCLGHSPAGSCPPSATNKRDTTSKLIMTGPLLSGGDVPVLPLLLLLVHILNTSQFGSVLWRLTAVSVCGVGSSY